MLHFQARWKQKKTEKCKLDLSPFPTFTSTLRHGVVYFVLQLQNEFIVFIFLLVFLVFITFYQRTHSPALF